MSDVILTNWTVYYADDGGASGGYKQITWTGGGGPEDNTNTVNELYSALLDLFSIAGQNDADDTTPMRAITPTVYQMGALDAGDLEPWFMDDASMQHLTGGSIQTIDWTRIQDSEAGIVKVAYTPATNQFIASDLGRTVTHDDTDTGTLLYFADNVAWIRPTDDTSTHNWDSGSGDFVATGGTGDVTQTATAATGERLWSNIITIGTVESNTRIYVAQSNVEIANFWGDGTVDRLYLVNDGFVSGLIDNGFLTVYARQFSTTYDHFITDVSAGGRTSVPLSTGSDLNNLNGFRTVPVTGAGDVFVVDEIVTGGTTDAKAVVTLNVGSPSTTSFEYYLIDDLTDFNSSETLTGSIIGANGSTTGAGPTNVGPSTYSDVTFTFGQQDDTFATTSGIDDGTEVITTTGTHPFVTGNVVDYSKEGGSAAVGLTEGTLYYVNDISSNTLSLHLTKADAIADTSRVDLTGAGAETHLLKRTFDLNENDVGESYSIIVDGAGRTLAQIYERMKYLNRRGETGVTFNGIEGQQYIGTDRRIDYLALTGTIDTGDVVTQVLLAGGTAFGTVQLHHTIDGFLMLRDTQGTFDVGGSANNLEVDGSNFVTMTGGATTTVITPIKVAPFGTFAGGTFFGSRGLFLESVAGGDANNFFLTTDGGVVLNPPASVPLTITVKDENGNDVEGARCRIEDTVPTLITEGSTNAAGVFSDTFTYTIDVDVNAIVRLKGFIPFRTTGAITASGFSVNVRFIKDTIVD